MTIKSIDSTLIHKIIPPRVQGTEKHPCLILLHGRGADENDLLGLAEYLDPRLLIISIRAPFPFDYGFGYTWFEMLENFQPELSSLKESHQILTQFLDDVVEQYPADPAKIFILGFSMGTVMGYLLLLTRPEIIRGLIANSGYFSEIFNLPMILKPLKKHSIFISHGTHDQVIPIHISRQAKEFFSKYNIDLTYKEYPMAHEISEESLNDFSKWLTQQLDKTE
ncbi:MAG: dienelactone hydrolase family protein [Bacteroidota bacterium]|nr:dienelactone hydrolase family protein [Bacteroidota bacterium]